MAHLPPVDMQDLDELKPILAMSEATMGSCPIASAPWRICVNCPLHFQCYSAP